MASIYKVPLENKEYSGILNLIDYSIDPCPQKIICQVESNYPESKLKQGCGLKEGKDKKNESLKFKLSNKYLNQIQFPDLYDETENKYQKTLATQMVLDSLEEYEDKFNEKKNEKSELDVLIVNDISILLDQIKCLLENFEIKVISLTSSLISSVKLRLLQNIAMQHFHNYPDQYLVTPAFPQLSPHYDAIKNVYNNSFTIKMEKGYYGEIDKWLAARNTESQSTIKMEKGYYRKKSKIEKIYT